MSNADAAADSADQTGGARRRRNADASQPVYSDAQVEITVPFGWGIKQLHCKINPAISSAEFDLIARDVQQAHMDEYFRAPIDIFEKRPGEPIIPYRRCMAGALRGMGFAIALAIAAVAGVAGAICLGTRSTVAILPTVIFLVAVMLTLYSTRRVARRLLSDRLWPGFLEERLKTHAEHMFAHAESDIRHVITKFVEVFIDNNRTRIRYKRVLQAAGIAGLFVGALPLLVLPGAMLASSWWIIAAAGWMAVWWAVTLWFFRDLNHDLFLHVYRQALNASSQEVSTVIMHRMTSLTALFHHYYNNIQQLQERGEDLGLGDMQNITDDQLKNGNGFFATRMLLWLAKRLEAIEESLLFGMQISESVLAVLNITGYVVSCVILWFSITVTVVVLGVDVWLARGDMFGGLLAIRLAVGGLLICAIWLVSHYSYHYKKWNSGRDILRSCFATATVTGWNTYAKLKFDIALAGRCQRAMARINHLDKKTGLSGG